MAFLDSVDGNSLSSDISSYRRPLRTEGGSYREHGPGGDRAGGDEERAELQERRLHLVEWVGFAVSYRSNNTLYMFPMKR